MVEKIKRIPIFKYKKSGKITAIESRSRFDGQTLIDMTADMREITKIRSAKYLKRNTLLPTKFILEVTENVERKDDGHYIQYGFLRILTSDDIDEGRWKRTALLSELPVGEHPHLSREEKLWAGERDGNIGYGAVLAIWACITWLWLYSAIASNDAPLFVGLVSAVSSYFLIRFKWKPPQKAHAKNLVEIIAYKKSLRQDAKKRQKIAQTDFEKLLENYSHWEQLSPHDFEYALKYSLEKKGYSLTVSKYSGDGGVDLEGTNAEEKPVIVQAKKYKVNVGVAVVREMIGVREAHIDRPSTIIVALVGFTKGAKILAKKEGIELRSVRKDILNL
ncbi:restriction endonuclease [Porticoccaceae bacterium]|nr:restriction endonuclease [Porticoccaceae bacterium]